MNNNNDLMSPQIDQLATALAKAQSEMPVAAKNQKNPFFKSSYADFEAIINASRPSLSKYGLSVVQSLFVFEDTAHFHDKTVDAVHAGQANAADNFVRSGSYLVTILMHASGQWIKSKARHNPPKNDIQSLSSYNTYLKRMCYTSLVGVAIGEDDDGQAAVFGTKIERTSTTYTK